MNKSRIILRNIGLIIVLHIKSSLIVLGKIYQFLVSLSHFVQLGFGKSLIF